jgi:hypothetical protein
LVFLRLNTGSVGLSPQELRQALIPGPFTDYVDDAAVSSESLKSLLKLAAPDPRMRDVEILARYISFSFFIESYAGRMKRFLDESFERLNAQWADFEISVANRVEEFEDATRLLINVLGSEKVARKPDSRAFNRAIFDALVFYTRYRPVQEWISDNRAQFIAVYDSLFAGQA